MLICLCVFLYTVCLLNQNVILKAQLCPAFWSPSLQRPEQCLTVKVFINVWWMNEWMNLECFREGKWKNVPTTGKFYRRDFGRWSLCKPTESCCLGTGSKLRSRQSCVRPQWLEGICWVGEDEAEKHRPGVSAGLEWYRDWCFQEGHVGRAYSSRWLGPCCIYAYNELGYVVTQTASPILPSILSGLRVIRLGWT